MRSFLDSIRALLRGTRKSPSLPAPTRAGEPTAAALHQIKFARENSDILALVGYLGGQHIEVTQAASEAIDHIIRKRRPLELVQLDQVVREVSEWRWRDIRPQDVAAVSSGITNSLGVISFNYSGYVREAAVTALGDIYDGQELPFLLIRLNDWVKPVRKLAKQSVMKRVRIDYADHWIRNLPLVYRLEAKGRDNHQDVVKAVLALLGRDECQPALIAALKSLDRQTCRLAFKVLSGSTGATSTRVMQEVLASTDGSLRLDAARRLRQRFNGSQLREILEKLSGDRLMPLRRETLYGYVEKLPDLAPAFLRAALLDPHVSMREAARFYLQQSGPIDFADIYRTRLDSVEPREQLAAIAGLGETGKAHDAALIAKFLRHPNARFRRAAVRAIGRLDPESFGEEMHLALQNEQSGVAKAARDVLLANRGLVSPTRLRSIFESSTSPLTRRVTLSLTATLDWWDGAVLLLPATASPDQRIREMALERLWKWQHSRHILYARPNLEQVAEVEKMLAQYGAGLNDEMRRVFNSVADYARRAQRG